MESGRTESAIGKAIFQKGGIPQINFENFAGVNYIAAYIDDHEDRNDYWLMSEVGGAPFTKGLYEVKGEFNGGERIYFVG